MFFCLPRYENNNNFLKSLELNKQKLRAQDKGDLAEEAKLCNAVGELLAQYGMKT